MHKLSLQGRDIHYTPFFTCTLTSVVHELAFPSMDIHYTVFCACAQMISTVHTHWSRSVHKVKLPSVDKHSTVNCICKWSSQVHKLAFQSKNRHYTAFGTTIRTLDLFCTCMSIKLLFQVYRYLTWSTVHLVVHPMVFPSVIIHEIVLSTCSQPLIVHKLAFPSMDIYYTVFCTCIRMMANHKQV